jgi:SAM-dependent methyltransferase/uncharacterized protein YbaR (Trm112 family)
MRPGIIQQFRGRDSGRLALRTFEESDGHVIEGALVEPDGRWYPIRRGVPCFLHGALRPNLAEFAQQHGLPPDPPRSPGDDGRGQELTNVSFSDKWTRFKRYGLEPAHESFLREWYCRKLGLPDEAALRRFYAGHEQILEVGPGSGFNSRFMAQSTTGQVYALDISDAAYTVHDNVADLENCHAIQADLMEAPFADESFDFIIADGVLHHTPDTRAGVEALYRKLRSGGRMFFYVYRRMGPIRQFTDEYVRERFTRLSPEECYQACEGFTELGRALSGLGARVTLDKGIPLLGIPPGDHDVQRLFYYSVLKCFWNDAFDEETNNMVNFDWYHPHHAWQHTREEVEGWLSEIGVAESSFQDANPNGLSVLLRRP